MNLQRFVMLLCFALWSSGAMAEIYKTVDKDGRIIYSDSPKSDNTEKVQLRSINTLPSEARTPPPSEPVASYPVEEEIPYELEIVSPRNNLVIPVGQRDLPIAVRLNQPLRSDHLLAYYLNDQLVDETSATNILIPEIARGIYVIRVEVIDADGQLLGTSEPVSVSLIRPKPPKPASPAPKKN